MYIYNNGLKCDASEKRIKLFEMVMPVLMAGLMIAGIVIIAFEFLDLRIAGSILLTSLLMIAWSVIVALVFSGIFKIWCKPVSKNR